MIAKCLCFLFFVGLVAAGHHRGPQGGHSTTSRNQDDHGNYAFKYDIVDGHGARNGREESGDKHHQRGSYYINDVDGRSRKVNYVADGHGFRAVIDTNEPGTKDSRPAAAEYNAPHAIPSGGYGGGYGHGGGYGYGGGYGGYGGGYDGGYGGHY